MSPRFRATFGGEKLHFVLHGGIIWRKLASLVMVVTMMPLFIG